MHRERHALHDIFIFRFLGCVDAIIMQNLHFEGPYFHATKLQLTVLNISLLDTTNVPYNANL